MFPERIAAKIDTVSWAVGVSLFKGRFDGAQPLFAERGSHALALSEIDRNLLERCLQRKPRAWEDFVDRFMGLVIHVVNHTARARSIRLSAADRDDLCAEVFLASIKNDFALLRNFRGKSSLATYLTVVARRIVVKELLARMSAAKLGDAPSGQAVESVPDPRPPVEERLGNQEEVQRLLERPCKGPKPRWFGCTIWKARATRKSARPSACPKTASAPS